MGIHSAPIPAPAMLLPWLLCLAFLPSSLIAGNARKGWWVTNEDGSEDVAKDDNVKCGTRVAPKISGGDEAQKHKHPWIARITGRCAGPCGGSLISTRHVLTAFHCFYCSHLSDGETVATFGLHEDPTHPSFGVHKNFPHALKNPMIHKMFPHALVISIIEIKAPEFADPDLSGDTVTTHDFAMAVLKDPVKFSAYIRPICIPCQGMPVRGKDGVAAGWGRTVPQQFPTNKFLWEQSPVLREVEMVVLNKKFDHKKMFGTTMPTKPYNPSSLNQSRIPWVYMDPCAGDSGGPLVWMSSYHRAVIIGTVHGKGYDCRTNTVASFEDEDVGVWNKVSEHSTWIKQTMKETTETTTETTETTETSETSLTIRLYRAMIHQLQALDIIQELWQDSGDYKTTS